MFESMRIFLYWVLTLTKLSYINDASCENGVELFFSFTRQLMKVMEGFIVALMVTSNRKLS